MLQTIRSGCGYWNVWSSCFTPSLWRGFKQFDPVADTETSDILVTTFSCISFKQFDPVADTETCARVFFTVNMAASNNSIRLRILKHLLPSNQWCLGCFKQFDPVADTETSCRRRTESPRTLLQTIRSGCGYWNASNSRAISSWLVASNNSIRLRILKLYNCGN